MYSEHVLAMIAQTLTVRDVIADMPRDFSAFVLYLMLIGSLVVIWRAGRPRPPSEEKRQPPPVEGAGSEPMPRRKSA